MNDEQVEKATETLRGLAGDVYSSATNLPLYNLWFFVGILKISKRNLVKIPRELVGYSNVVRIDPRRQKKAVEQKEMQEKLINLLKIESPW